MQLFSAMYGYGPATDYRFYAANTQEEATKMAEEHPKRPKGELRKVRWTRDLNDKDQITRPGLISFAGFGIKGPAQDWDIS